jgi:hypothetical protein
LIDVVLATLLLATSTACVDPAVLDRQIDEVLLALRPGLSLEQVATVTNTPQQELLPTAGQLLVFALAKGGHRFASVSLTCAYANDKLGECRALLPRSHTQSIEPAAYKKVSVGDPLGVVLAALCQPERVEVAPDGSVTLTYSLDYPFEAYLPYGPATFTFDSKSKLRRKVAAGR